MGRKVPSLTVEAACGPDSQSSWPWTQHQPQSTATDYRDLQDAAELEQNMEDEQFVKDYEKRARKRKQHDRNCKERLWQAEERIAMAKEDVRI